MDQIMRTCERKTIGYRLLAIGYWLFSAVKLLVTSDLHLVRVWRPIVLAKLAQWVREVAPDALLIAGDIAVAAEAETALRELRRVVPHGPIIVALANHDFLDVATGGCRTLEATIDRFWQAPAQRYNVTLLDQENFAFGAVLVVGGYGHSYIVFAVPRLRFEGKLLYHGTYFHIS